jgi:hypothetical protein
MSSNKGSESPIRDSAEWNGAWASVTKLAAARQVALRGLAPNPESSPDRNPVSDAPRGIEEASTEAHPTIDQGHFENAIAEIEEASAALKSAAPSLEQWQPKTAADEGETRKPMSVWLVIGTIWITMAVAIAGVIKAIGYFLG